MCIRGHSLSLAVIGWLFTITITLASGSLNPGDSHCLKPQSSAAMQLMCKDENVFNLWTEEGFGDMTNQQFSYSRSQLQGIAELFPADPVSWGSAVPNSKQAALLLGILNVTGVLLLQFDNFFRTPWPWQVDRAALVKKLHLRYLAVYNGYLANPEVPLINVIPKWSHGFYSNVEVALKNRSYTPDVGFNNRTFSNLWLDHKANDLYGPVWASFDWQIELPRHNLTQSFYALFNDGYYSSWYISLSSYLPMFMDGGRTVAPGEGSTPNAVNWVLNSTADLANFTALVKQYLTPSQQRAVLAALIYKPEADLLTTIVKLARVYSFDRANLVAEVVVLPLWSGFPNTEFETTPNWCAPRVNLGGIQSQEALYGAVSSLLTGDIIRIWGFGDEVFSEMPKFLLVAEAATPTKGAIIEDVWFDIAEKGYSPDWPRPTRTPVRREVSLHNRSTATVMHVDEFEERSEYYTNTSMSIVQVFGTLIAPNGSFAYNLGGSSAVVDINQQVADGKWHDRAARPPLETWGFDSAHRFCNALFR
jgi:hypothetical protein